MTTFVLEPADDDPFKMWIANSGGNPNFLGLRGATIKLGPKVCKTARYREFGDPAADAPSKRELRVARYERKQGSFDFDNPVDGWFIENEEIDKFLAFLHADVAAGGRYRVVDTQSPVAALLEVVGGREDIVAVLLDRLAGNIDPVVVGAALAQSTAGISAAEVAVIAERRTLVHAAAERATKAGTTESDMQPLIEKAWWLFGGRYVDVLPRRDLLNLDQHDIPLVCADRSLHIVELKGPDIPKLIHKYRNHWIVGTEVHEAVMQASNYIRTADEYALSNQTNVREELGIDVNLRRVSATVVIGHRDHMKAPGMPPEQFDLALRTYNATLSRVQVVTYDQLFEAARHSLDFNRI